MPVTSYARIHWQNLANFGVLPLAFEQADDCDRASTPATGYGCRRNGHCLAREERQCPGE
ncbi:hypothetical protein LMJ38_05060 [Streptomyces sp. R1]|uniref:hypothetical protein n=1 Tax=Streptomyces sp. R1 TaxID=1509279 RepID=UPI001E3E705D|nr:hypothetical protein [Streptomyces sp. R1]MCC8335297.1 hypothetical protein [Streptomyces sp. R1]